MIRPWMATALALCLILAGCGAKTSAPQEASNAGQQATKPPAVAGTTQPAAPPGTAGAAQAPTQQTKLDGYPRLGESEKSLPAELAGVKPQVKDGPARSRVYSYESPAGWRVGVTVDLARNRVADVEVQGEGPAPWQVFGVARGTMLKRVEELLGPGESEAPTSQGTQEYTWVKGQQLIALVIDVKTKQVIGFGLRQEARAVQ